jgi:hypothetical protein
MVVRRSPLDPEPAVHQQQDGHGQDPQRRRGGERDRRARRDQEAAKRRPDELVRGQLGGVQASVGPRQPVARYDQRQDRLCRGVVDRLGDADAERDDVEHPDRADVDHDGQHKRRQQDRPDGVGAQHGPAAVEPVGECAGWQREQQPRERQREGQSRDQRWGIGEADGDQRQHDLEDPVGQVRQAG